MAKGCRCEGMVGLILGPLGGKIGRRIFQNASAAFVLRQQRFDLTAQILVTCAGFCEKCFACIGAVVECLVKQRLDLFPTLRPHGSPAGLISRWSQAFASVHSRMTVPGETPRTSAVSSMLSSETNGSSSILLLCSVE